MNYTNKYDLPQEIVEWLMYDEYDYEEGVFSATRLMQSVRSIVLLMRHNKELSMDVSDMLASSYGTALHDSFEKTPLSNTIQEVRLYADIGKWRVSGKPDIVRTDQKMLKDIKSTSVWNYIYRNKDKDYIKQMSIYRFLLKENGHNIIDTAEVLFLFTDWSKKQAKGGGTYPPTRAASIEIKLWSMLKTKKYIKERLELIHEHLENTPDDELPFCDEEELWKRPDEWAVMKQGRKRATKCFEEKIHAETFIKLQKDTNQKDADQLFVLERPGTVNRCNYCPATIVCNQYRDLLARGVIAE